MWLHVGADQVAVPEDSFEYMADPSLRDILNTTLGVSCLIWSLMNCALEGKLFDMSRPLHTTGTVLAKQHEL